MRADCEASRTFWILLLSTIPLSEMAIASRADDASDCDSDGSSLLSSPSATPSPPPELRQKFASLLPTPPQSQDSSQTGSPSPDDSSTMNSDKDGPPPRKRRRISERAPRTTEYLDLRNGKPEDPDEQLQLARLLDVLHTRQKIVVVAGAGISVSAGSTLSTRRRRRRPPNHVLC